MVCRVIAISGTPGAGKSTVAKMVSRILNAEVIDLSELVIKRHLYSDYDEMRKSYIVDEALVKRELRTLVSRCDDGREYLVVEGHYAEIVDEKDLEILVVLRIDPRELVKRLCMRGWGLEKSLENGEAEYLGICLSNALEEHPREKVCEIDVTGEDPELIARRIVDLVKGGEKCELYIDWTTSIDPGELWETATRYCTRDREKGGENHE